MSAPGAPMPGGPGGSPEDLLMQIRQLLDQYLAMGEGTPVAPEAMALAQAIDGAMGGGGAPPEGGMPPEAGGMSPGGPPPDAGGAPPMPPPGMDGGQAMPDMGGMPGGDFGTFAEANDALLEDTKKKKSKGY